MMRMIKFIWDFRGPNAVKTAQHHVIHLNEFIEKESLPIHIVKTELNTEMQAIAYMVVPETLMNDLRERLKPHRGELYSE
nr:hypothetical protein [Imtechella halotolerans]